jgi:hypothetical protein
VTETEPTKPALSWFDEFKKRAAERKAKQEMRLRNRRPLPDESAIRERFVELNLRYFALSDPDFWEDSKTRSFWYCSDFLGAIRLGQHQDSFDRIIATCRQAEFPIFRHGKIEVNLSETNGESRELNASISYQLAETSEWTDALPWLDLPSVGACLDFPSGPNKVDCDAVSRRIEQTVEREYREGRLSSEWLVLVRTNLRQQALKSFGHLDPRDLANVTSKLQPTGMVIIEHFSNL